MCIYIYIYIYIYIAICFPLKIPLRRFPSQSKLFETYRTTKNNTVLPLPSQLPVIVFTSCSFMVSYGYLLKRCFVQYFASSRIPGPGPSSRRRACR